MKKYNSEIFCKINAKVGECPEWDERNNRLLWIDCISKKVYINDPQGNIIKTIELEEMVGSIALRQKEGALVGMENGIFYLDLESGKTEKICDPETHLPDNRMNDGKCDKNGRFWIGSMNRKDAGTIGVSSPKCNLYVLDTDLSCKKKIDDVVLSNGIAWTEDNRTMYYIDTPKQNVMAYDFNLDTAEITNAREVIKLPENMGGPDGMDIDTDGNLWIALWEGWGVVKCDPRTGEILGMVDVPVKRVTSCTFGGENYDKLYITTACLAMEDSEWEGQPDAGSVFVVSDTGATGRPFNRFKG